MLSIISDLLFDVELLPIKRMKNNIPCSYIVSATSGTNIRAIKSYFRWDCWTERYWICNVYAGYYFRNQRYVFLAILFLGEDVLNCSYIFTTVIFLRCSIFNYAIKRANRRVRLKRELNRKIIFFFNGPSIKLHRRKIIFSSYNSNECIKFE